MSPQQSGLFGAASITRTQAVIAHLPRRPERIRRSGSRAFGENTPQTLTHVSDLQFLFPGADYAGDVNSHPARRRRLAVWERHVT
jgi:hypothetical protein